MCVVSRTLVGGPYVDNSRIQPVELLCIEQVSALHSATRISQNAFSNKDLPEWSWWCGACSR